MAAQLPHICLYMYPPSFLLVVLPFSYLPVTIAFLIWALSCSACFVAAGWFARLPRGAILAGLLAPTSVYSFAIGQNGLLVSALLLAALGAAQRAPLRAGLAAGAMLIKPHFGLLLPFCYLASRNIRAFAAAAAAALVIAVASLALNGFNLWHYFFAVEMPAARTFMAVPWPNAIQGIMISPFIAMRAFGFGLDVAMAIQLAVSVACAGLAWYFWQPGGPQGARRIALTLTLIYLATPYAYIYDLAALAAALAALEGRQGMLLYAFFSLVGALYIPLSMISFPLGAFFLLLLLAHLFPRATAPSASPHSHAAL